MSSKADNNQPSDSQLLERIRNGDELASAELFNRYYNRLVRWAATKMSLNLRSFDAPSDIAQSAMKSVMLGIPIGKFQLESGRRLWALLVTVTIRKIINRSKKRRPDRLDHEVLSEPEIEHCQLELAEMLDVVAREQSELDQQITRCYLEGNTKVDIARKLDVTERTVFRAINGLESALQRLLRRAEHPPRLPGT
ncbi:MAG: hypothetical protein KDB22_00430 [Planctomycetales bacterium]|nr:hypothetical protein [Planctomycetales bacterium]